MNILAKNRAKLAISKIPKEYYSGIILDIGRGSNPYFLSTIDFNEKYGLDRKIPSIKNENINLINIDLSKINKLPFEAITFDVITALAVFEHIERHSVITIISEVFRILTCDGLFIMTTPPSWTKYLLKVLSKFNIVSGEEINEHKDLFTRNDLLSILVKSNFNEKNANIGRFEFFMNTYAMAKK